MTNRISIEGRGGIRRRRTVRSDQASRLRIPDTLHRRLIEAASKSNRSLSEEIQWRLEQSLNSENLQLSPSAERLSELLRWTANVIEEPIERSPHARLCLEAALSRALDHLSPVPPLPNEPAAAQEEAATRSAYIEAGRQLGDKLRIEDGAAVTLAEVEKIIVDVPLPPEMREAMSIRMEKLRDVTARLATLDPDDGTAP